MTTTYFYRSVKLDKDHKKNIRVIRYDIIAVVFFLISASSIFFYQNRQSDENIYYVNRTGEYTSGLKIEAVNQYVEYLINILFDYNSSNQFQRFSYLRKIKAESLLGTVRIFDNFIFKNIESVKNTSFGHDFILDSQSYFETKNKDFVFEYTGFVRLYDLGSNRNYKKIKVVISILVPGYKRGENYFIKFQKMKISTLSTAKP
jgi:hypothetical protein